MLLQTTAPIVVGQSKFLACGKTLIDPQYVAAVSAEAPACVLFNDGTRMLVAADDAAALIVALTPDEHRRKRAT